MTFFPDPGFSEPGVEAAPWRLDADPARVARSAQAWRELSMGVRDAGSQLARAATALLAEWAGPSAAAYRRHHDQVALSTSEVAAVAAEIATTLDRAADVLRRAQDQLDTGRERLYPSAALAAAAAGQVRAYTEAVLTTLGAELHLQRRRLWAHEVAAGLSEAESAEWDAAPEVSIPGLVLVDGDRVIVNGTGGVDDISIGSGYVEVNGVRQDVAPGARVVVRGGSGGDRIRLRGGAATVLGGAGADKLFGGDGDDTLLGLWDADMILGGAGADVILGGEDEDYLSGGAGDDVLDGGSGADTVYGLDGDDALAGGADRDVLDGGAGADRVDGGRGEDVLFGGRGRDLLSGGSDSDRLFGGSGTDTVVGGSGPDRAVVQPDDRVHGVERVDRLSLRPVGSVIRVETVSPEFAARVDSDLEALRSTAAGQQMFAALQASHEAHGDTLVIDETTGRPLETGSPRSSVPVGARVHYNPAYTPAEAGGPMRPVVELFHELAHAYDDFYDSAVPGVYLGADNHGVPNAEREAVGLPVDHDGQTFTADQLAPDHPYPLTENGLRTELGLPLRPSY